jgi:hypothetical protein
MISTAKDRDELIAHMGHKLVIVAYGDNEAAIECVRCNEVLYSVEGE